MKLQKGFWDVMQYDNGETPELEIVGRGNLSTEDSNEDEFDGVTDVELSDKIVIYNGHLKRLRMADGGLKVKHKIERLQKEIKRRHSQSKEVSQASDQLKGGTHQISCRSTGTYTFGIDQGATATSSAVVDNQRNASAFKAPQTNQTGYQAGLCGRGNDTSVFCLELGMMKGAPHDTVLEGKSIQRREFCNTGDPVRASVAQWNTRMFGGAKTCSVSKFYSGVDDPGHQVGPPLDSQEKIGEGNYSSADRKFTLSRVSVSDKSDKDDSFFAQNQIIKTRSPRGSFSPSISKNEASNSIVKKVQYGVADDKCLSGKRKHMDFIGTSVDTAMEVSDDEEKGLLECAAGVSQACNNHNAKRQGLRSSSNWKEGLSVAYPSGDPEAVEVQHSDLRHLAPFEFLNDTVIDFYIKYIQRVENLNEERRRKFHFFNSFFFKKLLLEKKKKSGNTYFSKLRKWTGGVNIFEKTYLLVPLHDSAHWSLAIICFATARGDGQVLTPYILHLDSMRAGHVSEDIFQVLKSYLEAECKHLKGMSSSAKSFNVVLRRSILKRVEVPQQENDWDCGLFLLFFIERFVKDAPPEFVPSSHDKLFGRRWFKPDEASNLRVLIRVLVTSLFQEANGDSVLEIVMEDLD